MKINKNKMAGALVISFLTQGVGAAFAHTVVEHHYHETHYHDGYSDHDMDHAAADGFLAGSSGASAALFFTAAVARKVGATPELVKDQAAAYIVNQENSVLLQAAMDEFKKGLQEQGVAVDTLSYDELVEMYLEKSA